MSSHTKFVLYLESIIRGKITQILGRANKSSSMNTDTDNLFRIGKLGPQIKDVQTVHSGELCANNTKMMTLVYDLKISCHCETNTV